MGFRAPVRDIAFALNEVAGLNALLAAGAFPDFDSETCLQILTAAGEFAGDVLAPLNRSGDLEGARFENGRVFAPSGFAEAYRRYAEGGWTALAAPEEFGGQGLPRAVALAVFEMVHAANMSFGLCPMLSEAAIHLLTTHGSARQKQLYLPKLVSGAWTGTMNLTEAQAGSDLALIRTRAERDGDKFRITGQKIFITWAITIVPTTSCILCSRACPMHPKAPRGFRCSSCRSDCRMRMAMRALRICYACSRSSTSSAFMRRPRA